MGRLQGGSKDISAQMRVEVSIIIFYLAPTPFPPSRALDSFFVV